MLNGVFNLLQHSKIIIIASVILIYNMPNLTLTFHSGNHLRRAT